VNADRDTPAPVRTDATCHLCHQRLLVFDVGRTSYGHRYAAVCRVCGAGLEFVVTGVAGEPGHERARESMLAKAFTVDAVRVAMARGLRGDLAWLAGSVEPSEAGGAA
jgi:hypothetical protein